jgi:hypothetical protein
VNHLGGRVPCREQKAPQRALKRIVRKALEDVK